MSRPLSNRAKLYEIAADTKGIITLATAEEVGVPAVEVRKLAHRGALKRIGQGVYIVPFFAHSQARDALEAVKVVNEDAFIRGESVLSMLNIGLANPRKIQVGTKKRIRRNVPNHIAIEQIPPRKEVEITYYQDVPCESLSSVFEGLIGKEIMSRLERSIQEAEDLRYLDASEAKRLLKKLNVHRKNRGERLASYQQTKV